MRLLVITRKVDRTDAHAGFTYRWVLEFARTTDRVDVICLEKGVIDGLPDNCHVWSLGKEQGKNRWRELYRFVVLASRIVPTVDGIFSHQNPEYGIMVAPWAKIFRKHLIVWYTHKSVTWKLRLVTWLADKVVSASPESFRLATQKLKVLHHGIDTELFCPAENANRGKELRLLSVGRVSASKQLERMIELVHQLYGMGLSNVRLIIAGGLAVSRDERYLDELKKMVHDKDLTQVVDFIGPVPNNEVSKLYQNADLVLNFSLTGSLDKAVLEAMACGVPVLVSNEAFDKILTHIDARMYTSGDSLNVTQQAYSLLTSDTRALRQKERLYVQQHHSLTVLVRELLALYEY